MSDDVIRIQDLQEKLVEIIRGVADVIKGQSEDIALLDRRLKKAEEGIEDLVLQIKYVKREVGAMDDRHHTCMTRHHERLEQLEQERTIKVVCCSNHGRIPGGMYER